VRQPDNEKNTRVRIRTAVRFIALLALTSVLPLAQAATQVDYNLNEHYAGSEESGKGSKEKSGKEKGGKEKGSKNVAVSGASKETPWVTATFHDMADGGVSLWLTTSNMTSKQRVESMYFNVKSVAANQLTFTSVTGPQAQVGTGSRYKAGGGGEFDLRLDFGSSFSGGQTAIYLIKGPAGFSASSFLDLSTNKGGHGPYYAAGKVVNASGKGSSWIATATPIVSSAPEPEIYAMMLLGLAMVGFAARRRSPRFAAASPQLAAA